MDNLGLFVGMETKNKLAEEIKLLQREVQQKQERLKEQKKVERRARFDELRAKEAAEIEATKQSLADEYKILRDAKFDRAWSIAWEYGHSSGIDEVKNHFHVLVELILP